MKIVSRRYDNYLLMTIIVLIVLPILLAFSNLVTVIYKQEIFLFSFEYFNNEYFAFQIRDYFQYGVFVVMLIVYPLYPSVFSLEKFFIKRNPENVIIEYEMLKKIVYGLFPLFIFAFVYLIGGTMKENPLGIIIKFLGDPVTQIFVCYNYRSNIFYCWFCTPQNYLANCKERIQILFCKSIVQSDLKKEDEAEKISYLVKALNSYNKYIRRSLGLGSMI